MTEGIAIRKAGHAGRITLDRPRAMNALTWEMCLAIAGALPGFASDEEVALLVIDGAGDRAFCSGGDIAEMYRRGRAGDHDYGRRFWRDEYAMNRALYHFPKPVVTLLQGYTMGGGVGIGCHGSHRVAGESARIAMPECGIGLVPDVGGSLILARAPGRMGEYLATTSARMGTGDAIAAGFADYFVPEAGWPALIAELEKTGDWRAVDRVAEAPERGKLAAMRAEIDAHFGGETLRDIVNALDHSDAGLAGEARTAIGRNSPLSMACAVELIHRVRGLDTIEAALGLEYRFTHRASEQADFLEGIRAAIVEKDRAPRWRHDDPAAVTGAEVAAMLRPLGPDQLSFEEES